jgi:transposase
MGEATYGQNWPAYNASQVHEKQQFLILLHKLCAAVDEPVQTSGRRRIHLSDMLFSMIFKVYSTVSARRFMTDLKAAHERGYISEVPSYNSILRYFGKDSLTPYLARFVVETSLPLAGIEEDFAVDSTGFSTSVFDRWRDTRNGKGRRSDRRKFLKTHLMCGVLTNIVTAVIVTKGTAGDSPQLKKLYDTTRENFRVKNNAMDNAYLSLENLHLMMDNGTLPLVPFKANSRPDHSSGDPLWARLFHFYKYNEEWLRRRYHKRSNIESTNSMVKRKFGAGLMSRKFEAQVNEILCKIICHNLCVLIQSMYDLGIQVSFWTKGFNVVRN